jgi:hypothetical protein
MTNLRLIEGVIGLCVCGFFVTVAHGQSLTVTVNNSSQTVGTNQAYNVNMTLTTSSSWVYNFVSYSVASTCNGFSGGTWSISPNRQVGQQFQLPTGAATYTVFFSGGQFSEPGNCVLTFTFQTVYTNISNISALPGALLCPSSIRR